jgi:glutamate synthase domain-containing protein 3
MISMKKLDKGDRLMLKDLLEKHLAYTGSEKAELILDKFDEEVKSFIKIVPNDYQKVLDALEEASKKKLSDEEQLLYAFGKVVDGEDTAHLTVRNETKEVG